MKSKDHRDLISIYDLGHIEQHSPGLIHWHPNGAQVLRKLQNWILELHEQHAYQEVRSPIILSRDLWEKSGHWAKYQDLMFSSEMPGEQPYAIKPMSCPGHISIYDDQRRSYRDLPMRLFEFGSVHRREPSGALSGWMRLRGFVQDDSHVFCDKSDINAVISGFISMVERVYHAFGFESWSWRLALRPELRSGGDRLWNEAEEALRQACASLGIEVIEAPGEGAFYGPKLEAALVDRLGRQWQCGVAQLDFVLPERFDLSFQASSGQLERPVMIHHAVLGSLERWLAIVMESQGALPDWLSPYAVAILPIGKEQLQHAQEISAILKSQGVAARVLDDGPLSGRLRRALDSHYAHIGILGKREVEANQVSVRQSDGQSAIQDQAAWMNEISEKCRAPKLG